MKKIPLVTIVNFDPPNSELNNLNDTKLQNKNQIQIRQVNNAVILFRVFRVKTAMVQIRRSRPSLFIFICIFTLSTLIKEQNQNILDYKVRKQDPMHFVALIFILGLQVLDVKGHGAMVSPLSRNAIGKEMRRYESQIR